MSGTFHCTWCIDAGKDNRFTQGKASLTPKVDDFRKHENGVDHKFAVQARACREGAYMQKAAGTAYQMIKEAIVATMKNVYYLAQGDFAKEKLQSLNEHTQIMGCRALDILTVDQRVTYTSHSACDDFLESIASVLQTKILARVLGAKFYSLVFDESTDCSTSQNLIVYVRVVVEGKVESHFLSLAHLNKGCTAEDIFEKLGEILKSKGLPRSSLVAVSCDGASVMMGKDKGVVTRLKKEIPHMVNAHCAAHKLALVSSQAASDVPYLVTYQEVVNSIYKYFKQSPKHQLSATITQTLLSEKNLKYKQVFGTRWLSFHNSVLAILKTFDSLIATLQSDATQLKVAKASGLVKLVAKFQFVATSYMLMDVLSVLNRTCLTLQSANLVYSDIIDQIDITKASLETLQAKDGPHFSEFLASLPMSPDQLVEEGATEIMFKSHLLPFGEKQLKTVNQVKVSFLRNLLDHLAARFDYSDGDVLKAFNVLNPAHVPEDLPDSHGEEDIHLLGKHFGSKNLNVVGDVVSGPVDSQALEAEWPQFVHIMHKYRLQSFANFWCVALQKFQESYPNICSLGQIYLTLPPTSVDAERGFSRQNLIKSSLRASLTVSSLDKLMLIKIEGPALQEFDFDKAFNHWCEAKDRRAFLPRVSSNITAAAAQQLTS